MSWLSEGQKEQEGRQPFSLCIIYCSLLKCCAEILPILLLFYLWTAEDKFYLYFLLRYDKTFFLRWKEEDFQGLTVCRVTSSAQYRLAAVGIEDSPESTWRSFFQLWEIADIRLWYCKKNCNLACIYCAIKGKTWSYFHACRLRGLRFVLFLMRQFNITPQGRKQDHR